jgi:hypothetical protein
MLLRDHKKIMSQLFECCWQGGDLLSLDANFKGCLVIRDLMFCTIHIIKGNLSM